MNGTGMHDIIIKTESKEKFSFSFHSQTKLVIYLTCLIKHESKKKKKIQVMAHCNLKEKGLFFNIFCHN